MMKSASVILLIGAAIHCCNVLADIDESFLKYEFAGDKVLLDKLEADINVSIKVTPAKPGKSIPGYDSDCIKFRDKGFPNRLIYVCVPTSEVLSALASAYSTSVGVVSQGQTAPLEEVSMKVLPVPYATLDCSASSLMCKTLISTGHTTRTPCTPYPSPLGNLLCYHVGYEGLSKHRCYNY